MKMRYLKRNSFILRNKYCDTGSSLVWFVCRTWTCINSKKITQSNRYGFNWVQLGTDDRTWTCTLFALEPKSNVSANFTTSAKRYYYSIKSSNVKQKAESQASLYDFANFFYFYIKKLLHFADCFDIVISACGSDSVVECHLAKVKVAGPNPVSRSTQSIGITRYDTAS